ncbi:MAG: glutathione S-transferase [Gammaproteobacteria bacterium]|nr:glutathione S-transferase [Gammaproteobacteria bacterium]
MQLYDCETAPSPRRVRIFIAEKGVEVPRVQVSLKDGEQFSAEFRAKNPLCTVPVLELDDGTCISGAPPVCRYLEEIYPEPALLGRDPVEKALITMWGRRMENEGFEAVAEAFRNATPGFKNRALTGPHEFAQVPALADRGRQRVALFLDMLNDRLAATRFVAGPVYSVADITALVTIDFCRWIKAEPADRHADLRRWYDAVSARPSAAA